MDILVAADRLMEARIGGACLTPFSQDNGGITEAEAWAIAAEVDRRLIQSGRVRTGHKLGWTSMAMREAMGIDRANFGSLWDDMELQGSLCVSSFRHPKAEPEFAFHADVPLRGRDIGAADVERAGRWAVALEIVDPRWQTYDFTWLDNTADGSSAAGYLTGPFHAIDVTPDELTLTLTWPGGPSTGNGSAAMGSPAEAVAYLVRQLAEVGDGLEEGMIVLTGGVTPPIDLTPGLQVRVTSPLLGSCSLTVFK